MFAQRLCCLNRLEEMLSSEQAEGAAARSMVAICVFQQSSAVQSAELPSEHGQVCSRKAVLKIKGKSMQKRTSCPQNPGLANGERATPDRPDVRSEGS